VRAGNLWNDDTVRNPVNPRFLDVVPFEIGDHLRAVGDEACRMAFDDRSELSAEKALFVYQIEVEVLTATAELDQDGLAGQPGAKDGADGMEPTVNDMNDVIRVTVAPKPPADADGPPDKGEKVTPAEIGKTLQPETDDLDTVHRFVCERSGLDARC